MFTHLQSYAALFRQSESDIIQVARTLTHDQFNWRPSETAWSIAECVEHLNRVADAFLPPLEAAARRTKPTGEGPFTYGFVARKLIAAMEPGGPTLTASRSLDPSKERSHAEREREPMLAALSAYTDRYVAVCEAAEGLNVAKIKVRYPFFRLLRLPLGAFLQIAGLHALRHARQVQNVSKEVGFPLGSGKESLA